MKFINIISVSDGNEKELELTIKSVKNQIYNFYKHIIIAKKLSKKFIIKYKSRKIIFIVGKDKSIYNAMNIGEKISFKKHTIYLNSGDVFFSNKTLEIISNKIAQTKNLNIQFVSILKFNKTLFYPRKKYFYSAHACTHSSFIRSPIKKKNIIFYDENFKITADGQWMKENIKLNGLKKFYIPITIFSLNGISTLPSIKTILIKKRVSLIDFYKEIIKYIILRLVSKKFFYLIIYSKKYFLKK